MFLDTTETKSQTYKVKEHKIPMASNLAPGITRDTNQVRSSVPDPMRHYERGGCGSPAMKRVKKFGRMK